MNIVETLQSPKLFQPFFASDSWSPWKTALSALFALPMSDEQALLYRECTGRTKLPEKPFKEAAFVIGRRGGKSRILALIATYVAAFIDHAPFLAVGETAVAVIICPSRAQSRLVLSYVMGLLRSVPALAAMVEGETSESVTLSTRCRIEVGTASFKATRGFSYCLVCADESAFWPMDDSARPDTEILRALRPGMLSLPHSMLILASSPYAKRGELYRMFRKFYGTESSRVLVWRASTEQMNLAVDRDAIQDEREADPESAQAEYDAIFREGLSQFVPREIVEAAVETGLFEFPPLPNVSYHGFCDPSGGSSDLMTLGIAHKQESGLVVLDYIGERKPPYDPDDVCREFSEVLARYGLGEVTGDKYGGIWPADRFSKQKHVVSYLPSELPKSQLYLELLPLLMAKRVQLLDNRRLVAQLCALERRAGRIGKDTVDHQPGSFDDVANAAAGALVLAAAVPDVLEVWARIGSDDGEDAPPAPVAEPEHPAVLTASNHPGIALLTIPGEPVLVAVLSERVGFPLNNGRMVMLAKGQPIEIPRRLLDNENWLLRDGLRVCRVEMVEIRDAA